MYCLTNVCYVCLETKDKSLVNINKSLSVNKDIIHIIGYLPFNLAWLNTKRIILICEECCLRLRETYHFLAMCLKNSSLLQGYMDKLNSASISNTDNEAKLHVELNNKHNDINKIKCEIKLEDEEIYTVEAVIEETEDENIDDSFVKEEDTWKREEVIDKDECPMDNNSTECRDNGTYLEIFVNNNIHVTEADSDSSRFKSTQLHTSNKQEPNTAAKKLFKCLTCSKSFSTKTNLQIHTRVHTGEKSYNCATCKKCFVRRLDLVCHMRTHTGEKPYKCTTCKKMFRSWFTFSASYADTYWRETGINTYIHLRNNFEQSHIIGETFLTLAVGAAVGHMLSADRATGNAYTAYFRESVGRNTGTSVCPNWTESIRTYQSHSMGATFSTLGVVAAVGHMLNGDRAIGNGYNAYFREYVSRNRERQLSLPELGRMARRAWRRMSACDRQIYIRNESIRQESTTSLATTSAPSTTTMDENTQVMVRQWISHNPGGDINSPVGTQCVISAMMPPFGPSENEPYK